MMGKDSCQRDRNDVVKPPPLPVNPQPTGDQWHFRRFKDFSPPIFKGSTDAKVAKDWLKEVEKIFKVMDCTKMDKLKLAEFSLKNECKYGTK